MSATGHDRTLTTRVYKALAIFSGAQSVGILCSVVRTKLVALWIGAAGVGLFGLCNTAVEMMATLTQLSLRSSAVRDLSATPEGSDRRRILSIVVSRWALLLGVGGMALMIILSPWLAEMSFGSREQWWMFAALSPVLLAGSVTGGRQALMQADGQLGALARSSLWGVAAALVLSVPLLWWLRMRAIVPVIVIYSFTALAATLLCAPRCHNTDMHVSLRDTLRAGSGFLRLGLYMTLSGFTVWASSYLFLSWMTSTSGETAAGYYQAGSTLLVRYAGVLFTAIGMEYYPRIAGAAHDRRRLSVYAGHEILTLLRVAVPVSVLFAAVAPLIVRLLYSAEFDVIVPFVTIGTVGLIARVGAWCISYIMIVRADGMLFLITETVSAALSLGLNILCYSRWGVAGLGYAFTAWYLLYLVMMWCVCRIRYRMRINRRAVAWLLTALVTVTAVSVTCLACRY